MIHTSPFRARGSAGHAHSRPPPVPRCRGSPGPSRRDRTRGGKCHREQAISPRIHRPPATLGGARPGFLYGVAPAAPQAPTRDGKSHRKRRIIPFLSFPFFVVEPFPPIYDTYTPPAPTSTPKDAKQHVCGRNKTVPARNLGWYTAPVTASSSCRRRPRSVTPVRALRRSRSRSPRFAGTLAIGSSPRGPPPSTAPGPSRMCR